MASYGRLPLTFEPNVGQTDPAVRYLCRNGQFTVFLTPTEAVFVIAETRVADKDHPGHERLTGSVVRMQLVGASGNTEIIGEQLSPGQRNYLLGNDPAKWHVGVPLYSQATYREIYPGVDLRFHGGSQQLEFDFVVRAGADPRYIALALKSDSDMRTNDAGDLVLPTSKGELHLNKPVAYQEADDGTRQPVDARFVLGPNHAVGFALGEYDHQRKLVIDPMVTLATYLGGSLQDEGLGIALDGSQDVYITGATASVDFPVANPYQFSISGTVNAFITELDPTGSTLIFSTYYGGQTPASGEVTVGRGIAVDSVNGFVFITGYSNSQSLPNFGSQFYAGGWDAFLAVLPFGGQSVSAAAYLGGTANDFGTAITFDNQDNAWIVGQTFSGDFPVVSPLSVPNGSQINLGNGTGPSDSFVAEITASSVVIFATYYGGSQQDFATSVAISNQTTPTYDVYFAGGTNSPDFFVTPNAIQQTCGNGPATGNNCNGGLDDGFVAAINYNSGAYTTIQSTFLGGSGQDDAYGVALDASENVYVTGHTDSPGTGTQPFPTAGSPFQSALQGVDNAFFTQFNPLNNVLLYSTYLGGSGKDAGLGITLDPSSNVYLTGRTNSTNFPTVSPTQATIGGGQDAFISTFLPSNGSFLLGFSTFLGGSGDENLVGGGIAVDSSQNAYVAGDTNSSDFPVTSGAFQSNFNGTGTCTITTEVPPGRITAPCEDAFIAKILTLNNPALTLNLTGTGVATVTSTPPGINCSNPPNTCSASFPFGTQITLAVSNTTNTTFNGWSGAGCSGTGSCVVTMTANQQVAADFSLNQTNEPLTVTLGGNGSGTVTSVPPGINCHGSNMGCTPANFQQNTVVTLTATADPNSTFAGWSGACANATGPCVVTMTSAVNVIATFTANPLPVLTVGLLGIGSGLVTSSPAGINCSSPTPSCMQTFAQGTTVTLSAVAASGSRFAGWGGACTNTTGSCVVAMNSNQTVTATFTLIPIVRLSINVQGTGSGTVTSNPAGISCPGTCTDTFPTGTTITVTATPANGSLFLGWGGDANSQGCSINPVCTFTPAQPGTLVFSATFSLPTSQNLISVSFTGKGSGTVVSTPAGINCPGTCSALFDSGLGITLTATAGNSSVFNGWGQSCSGTSPTCQLTVSQNTKVTADFGQVNPTLTVQINDTGIGTGTVTSDVPGINCPGSCGATYPPGTVVTLTAAPGQGSTFTGWGGGANSYGCFTNPTCQITLGQSVQLTAGFDEPPPVPPPFNLTVSPTETETVPTGTSTAYGLTMLSQNGYTDTVNLTCTVQPGAQSAPTCLLNPASISLGANQAASSTLTINAFTTTGFLHGSPLDRHRSLPLYALGLPLSGFALIVSLRGQKSRGGASMISLWLGLLLVISILSFHVGCGGGASNKPNGSTSNAAPGQYTVTVVATGTTTQVQQTAVVTVMVK